MAGERKVEDYFTARVQFYFGIPRKWVSPGHRGVEDQIVLWPAGVTHLVELKDFAVQPEDYQIREHQRHLAQGHWVFVLDSTTAVDEYLQHFLNKHFATVLDGYVWSRERIGKP